MLHICQACHAARETPVCDVRPARHDRDGIPNELLLDVVVVLQWADIGARVGPTDERSRS